MRWIARIFAEAARGFLSSSSALATTGFFVNILAVGVLPQMQTGADGGHVQGFSKRRNACLTIRSSSE